MAPTTCVMFKYSQIIKMSKKIESLKMQIKDKAAELITNVYNLSDNLPDNDFLLIRDMLLSSVETVPDHIEKGYKVDANAVKVKYLIKVFQSLSECKNYLRLVQTLNYAETEHIVEKVNEIVELIIKDFPSKVTFSMVYENN